MDDFGRLRSVDDGGFLSIYLYNQGRDRRVKLLGATGALHYDGDQPGAVTGDISQYMLYPDASTVSNNGARVTRHIFAGSTRVISTVGDARTSTGITQAGDPTRNSERLAAAEDSVASLFSRHNLPFVRPDLSASTAALRAQGIAAPESYFYHGDHLGNTTYMTNRAGAVTQHAEYLPFGEPLIEQSAPAALAYLLALQLKGVRPRDRPLLLRCPLLRPRPRPVALPQ